MDAERSDPAANYLLVELALRRRSVFAHAIQILISIASSIVSGQPDGLPNMAVVDISRANGAEVLRVPASSIEEASTFLARVQHGLDQMTVAEFAEEWHIDT